MMVIVHKGRVVVVLAPGNTGGSSTELPTLENVVVQSAEEAILSQSEFIARY